MKKDQIKLLASLAKEIKEESKNKAHALLTLQCAKILTKQGNFSGKYSNLNRIVVDAE
jgi:hypothetical protein